MMPPEAHFFEPVEHRFTGPARKLLDSVLASHDGGNENREPGEIHRLAHSLILILIRHDRPSFPILLGVNCCCCFVENV